MPKGKTLFLITGLAVLIVVLILLNVFYNQGEGPVTVASIEPAKGTLLKPGDKVEFKLAVSPPNAKVLVKIEVKKIQTDDDFKEMTVKTSSGGQEGVILVTSEAKVLPISEYLLTVETGSGKKLGEVSYMSDEETPKAEVDNDLKLKEFLPYETESFRLTYAPERNVYIFSFKVNTDSKDSVDTQYEKAKNEALEFIKSKGVDVNKIVIEWRFS